MVEDAECADSLSVAQHDGTTADSHTDGELMSSSGSESLQRQFSASSGDGLSDKEDVLEAVKSQVRHISSLYGAKQLC